MNKITETRTIPLWKLEEIEEVLRMAAHIHLSPKRETCFDRCVMRTWNDVVDIIQNREPSIEEQLSYYNQVGQTPYNKHLALKEEQQL